MKTPLPVLVDLLRARARVTAYRSVLAGVVALAGEAPGLSDLQVRVRLVELAERAAGELEGQTP